MKLVSTFAPLVQIDICDGVFVPVKTWPYNGVDVEYFEELKHEDAGWPEWEETDIELHLMIQNPEIVLLDWIHTGVASIVVHIETVETSDIMQQIIDTCRKYTISIGIALKLSTDISRIESFVEQIDFIQCMGSDKLGFHGVPLDPRAIEKIKTLRSLYPERIIAIDIGVTEETAQELIDAGANKLIVGGIILSAENPQEVYSYLSSLE